MLIKIFLLALFCPLLSLAGNTQFGIFAGLNYNKYIWYNASQTGQLMSSGYGGGGGLSLSFFQYHRFGFRIAAADNFISQSSTTPSNQIINLSGSSPMGVMTFDVNFDLNANRHSFGIGYGYESISSITASGSGSSYWPTSNSFGGVAIDGKDFWKNGWFDYVMILIPISPNGFYSMLSGILGVGYEFGGKGD